MSKLYSTLGITVLSHWLIMTNYKTLPGFIRIQRCGYVWETCLYIYVYIGYLRKIWLSSELMCNMYTYIQPISNLHMIILVVSLYTCITCKFPLTSRLYVHCSDHHPLPPWFFRSFSKPYSFPNSAAGAPRDVNKSPMEPRVPPKDTPTPGPLDLGFFCW